jgi:ribosomal protein RSM22 (predicted rRNA methylase)
MNWEQLDWEILDRLRETFLSDAKSAGPYWHTISDLECYNLTYGERIGWKWDAVLAELRQRGWAPCGELRRTILDWGCGSGVAGRRVIDFFGPANFSALRVHDHSELAMDFAEHHGRKKYPQLDVARADTRFLRSNDPIGVLVLSHVLNELDDIARSELAELCARAQTILWVEPGTHEVSRALGGWREKLRATGLHAVAPCPHNAACGVLATGNERHWCHFFASPPASLYADSDWVKFGQRAGIDLRSLPYSFLVLDRNVGAALAPTSRPQVAASSDPTPDPDLQLTRILGEPRHYKGYAKIFACDAAGVAELMLQKRDAPELFKALKQGSAPMLHRWTHLNGRIIQIDPL